MTTFDDDYFPPEIDIETELATLSELIAKYPIKALGQFTFTQMVDFIMSHEGIHIHDGDVIIEPLETSDPLGVISEIGVIELPSRKLLAITQLDKTTVKLGDSLHFEWDLVIT